MDKDNDIFDDQLNEDDLFDLDLDDLTLDEPDEDIVDEDLDDDIIELVDLVQKGDKGLEEIAGEDGRDSSTEHQDMNDLLSEIDAADDDEIDIAFADISLDSESFAEDESLSEEDPEDDDISHIDFDQILKEEADSVIDLTSEDQVEPEEQIDDDFGETPSSADTFEEEQEKKDILLDEDISDLDFEKLLSDSSEPEQDVITDSAAEDDEASGLLMGDSYPEELMEDDEESDIHDVIESEFQGIPVAEEDVTGDLFQKTDVEDTEESSILMEDSYPEELLEEAGEPEFQGIPVEEDATDQLSQGFVTEDESGFPEESATFDISKDAAIPHITLAAEEESILPEEAGDDRRTLPEDDAVKMFPVSEEKIEAIVERIVGDVVERVARETMAQVAEKLISEAIDSLKKSLESSSD